MTPKKEPCGYISEKIAINKFLKIGSNLRFIEIFPYTKKNSTKCVASLFVYFFLKKDFSQL